MNNLESLNHSVEHTKTVFEVEPSISANDQQEIHQSWLKRNLLKLSIGSLAVGGIAGFAANPTGHIEKEIIKTEAWAGIGLGVTEGMWVGGAYMMAKGAGLRTSDKPWKIRRQWDSIKSTPLDNPIFKAGLAINTVGALGTAGVVAAGATFLPEAAWVPAFGWVAFDIGSTVLVRSGIYKGMKEQAKYKSDKIIDDSSSKEKQKSSIKVREAKLQDIDRLADIDLQLFDKAYGQEKPKKSEIIGMLTKRLENNPGWMFVSTVDGQVEGFVTGFLTNKSAEDFKSWEDCTNNGTLEGRVDRSGRYVYVVNMTIKPEAVKLGAEEMLLAQLFAKGIHAGAHYGYFVSRMPSFSRWAHRHGRSLTEDVAQEYAELRDKKGKLRDPLLRMYEKFGFELGKPIKDAFQDEASANYGVVCKAYAPTSRKIIRSIPPLRWGIALALKQASKNPTLIRKII